MRTNVKNNSGNNNFYNTAVYNNGILQNSKENIDWNGTNWKDLKFSHPERTINIATSCSGIGAPEQSLLQLGLKSNIVFAGDIDKNCKKSYFANYDITEENWHDDLFKFADEDLSRYKDKVSIFLAGICCQQFSRAGSMKGIENEELGGLYKPFKTVIEKIQPKVWIMENVDNMLTLHKGYDWSVIKKHFDELGYDIHYQVLNACDYGVPQSRKRLFCIGFKEPRPDFLFPAPIELDKCVYDVLEDPTPGIRQITPREALRLQGFSENYKIVVGKTAAYNQAGNSIAVPVLKSIFKQMDITRYGF